MQTLTALAFSAFCKWQELYGAVAVLLDVSRSRHLAASMLFPLLEESWAALVLAVEVAWVTAGRGSPVLEPFGESVYGYATWPSGGGPSGGLCPIHA